MIRELTIVTQDIHRNLRLHGSAFELAAGGLGGTAIRAFLVLNRLHRADQRSLSVKYRFLGPATYLTTGSFPRLGFNRRSAEIEELVQTCLLSVMPVHGDLTLFLDVTSANGGTRVHSINAGSALLLRQGLMQESTFAISVGRRDDGQLITDVNYLEDSSGDLDLCMGLKVDADGNISSQITFLQQEGTVSLAQFERAYELVRAELTHIKDKVWTRPTFLPSHLGATARATPSIRGTEPFLIELASLHAKAKPLLDPAVSVAYFEGTFIRGHDAYGNQMSLAISLSFDAEEPSLKVTYDPASEHMYGRWSRDPCLDARIIDRLLRSYIKVHQLLPEKQTGFPRVELVFSSIKGQLSYRLLQFLLRRVLNQVGRAYDRVFMPDTLSLRLFTLSEQRLLQVCSQDCRIDQTPMLLLFKNGPEIVLLQKQGIGTLPFSEVLALLKQA
jgi:ribonuclease PH